MAELTFYVPIFVWIFFNCALLASASNVPLRKLLFVTTTLSYLNHMLHSISFYQPSFTLIFVAEKYQNYI